MKKIYAMTLGVTMTLSAAASNFETVEAVQLSVRDKAQAIENIDGGAIKQTNQHKPATASVSKDFSTIDGVCGIYTYTYYDYFDKVTASTQIKIEKSENENEVAISGMYNSYVVYATFDADAQTLNFPKAQVVNSSAIFNPGTISGTTVTFTEAAGKLDAENGTITFDPDIYLGFRSTSTSGGWYSLNNQNVFSAIDESTLVTITSEQCTGDNKISITIKPGSAVSKVMYGIYKGFYQATEANIKTAATKGNAAPGNNLTYNGAGKTKGVYTIIIAGLDAEGNILSGDECHFYISDTDNSKWKDVEGTAIYSEGYIASVYGASAEDYEVAVQVNTETPGYIRLVNPYGSAYPFAAANAHDAESHPHYLYIHAEDHSKVWIDQSPIGFEVETGVMLARSYVEYLISKGKAESEYEQYYGTLDPDTRCITFPEKALLLQELSDKEGNLYYANKNGEFAIVLPEAALAGVNEIEVDEANAPVEYFNLQGVRVDNPENGLFIRRQGNKAEKVVIK